jgi:hypothetical protein
VRRALFLLIPAAVIGFVVAGCGGSKESAGTTTRAGGFSTVEATTQATTPATTSTPKTTPTSTLASAKDCRDLEELGKKFSSAFSGAANSQNLKKEAELLKQFAERTPSDVRADFRLVADYMSKVADAVGDIKPGQTPSAEALAKLQKLSTQIDQAKLTAASAHISAWVQKNCAK